MEAIHNYLVRHFSYDVADRVVGEIIQRVSLLPANPFVGRLDPLFEKVGLGHRYVVQKYTRIVYRVLPDHIRVTNVYDMRMDPSEFILKEFD